MSRRSLAGAVALITGAGGGLGSALALRFARGGCHLALLDREAASLDALRPHVEASGVQCLVLAADVTDPDACSRAVAAVRQRFDRLDVLVNNAGITHRSAFADTDPAVLRRVMDVNFFGAVNLTQGALPLLRRSRGLVVAISSVAGFSPLVARTGYAASKHALHGFFESLRPEVAPDGVSVMLVCPSFIATEIGRHAYGGDGRPAGHAQVVVGRPLAPDSVADRIWQGAARNRRLLLIGRTARQAWWLSRIAPALYERAMARRLWSEMQRP